MRPRMEGGETSDTYMGESSETAADGDAAEKSRADEERKAWRRGRGHRGEREQHRNPHQHALAAEAIGEPARGKRAQHAAEQQGTERPSQTDVAEREVPREERAGSGNDGDIESEEQAPERGRARQKNHIAQVRGFRHELPV